MYRLSQRGPAGDIMALLFAILYATLCIFKYIQTPYDWIIFFAIICAPGISKFKSTSRESGDSIEVYL